MKLLQMLSSMYHETAGRFIICSRLYKLDLSDYTIRPVALDKQTYKLSFPTIEDLNKLEDHYKDVHGKIGIVRDRFNSGDYICIAYEDLNSNSIAYTRWLCFHRFFSSDFGHLFEFGTNEVFTLDSYTAPQFRKLGLHHQMNIEMLNWLKQDMNIEFVYMVIRCFIPHLAKIPMELGYRPISRRVRRKPGSVKSILALIARKLSWKHGKIS